MATVRTEGLTKRYGSVVAVDHLDVEIKEGSLTAVLGPSGCGKTTLLRCIAGLTTPDAGRIYIGDEDVTTLAPSRRNLGMVFQRPSMFPHMTAFDNIAWGLQLRKWPKDKIASRVKEMLRLVQLEGMEDRRFAQLSGGQAQRVVIARALAPAPRLLLLDEPLSSLDAKLRDQLKLEIAEIHRKARCTTILVTHDQAEALTIADNVLLMYNGKIVQEGAPLDVYRYPQTLFSADFIGTNNFLPGRIVAMEGGARVALDGVTAELHVPKPPADMGVGTTVWACIRADDVDIIEEDQRSKHRNVIPVKVERASMTGGTVIIEGRLDSSRLRVHVSGSRRFEYLTMDGKTILCALGPVSLIRREPDELAPKVSGFAPLACE